MSKRSMMRGDEAFLREQAIKRARWAKATDPAPADGIANCVPVQLPEWIDPSAVSKMEAVEVREIFGLAPKRKARPVRSDTARPYFALLTGLLRPHGIPEPRCEWQFDSTRRWRFDFCWITPTVKLALEIDGGIWINGGHNRGAALLQQMEKQNAAVLAGWRVLRYAPNQLTKAADDIRRILK